MSSNHLFFVALVDTSIALVAGLIIFAFLFEAGAQSAAGPGLVFISLPVIFEQWGTLEMLLPYHFCGIILLELLLLFLRIEPVLMFFIERFNMSRRNATIMCGSVFYILGIIAPTFYVKFIQCTINFFQQKKCL